jgi:hypothetical protein
MDVEGLPVSVGSGGGSMGRCFALHGHLTLHDDLDGDNDTFSSDRRYTLIISSELISTYYI